MQVIDTQRNCRDSERGNVLFLILIAVVLFGALSYAVTSSSRSGGSGNAANETNLVNSAQVAQYPASVRTAIVRMVVGGGLVEDLLFDRPADFAGIAGQEGNAVFHPSGGGASSAKAPATVMEDDLQGDWFFSSEFQVENIGTTDVGGSNTANEIAAFLPGINRAICLALNDQLGIIATGNDADGDGVPAGPTGAITEDQSVADSNTGIAAAADAAHYITGAFNAQPFGCYDSADGTANAADQNVYYHVLIER